MRKVKTVSISLPLEVLAPVDQAAKEAGLSRSSFISFALSMNEQVKEARKNGSKGSGSISQQLISFALSMNEQVKEARKNGTV